MFERIVIYCMTKCCTKCCRKNSEKAKDNLWDPKEDGDDSPQATTVETQATSSKPSKPKKDGDADNVKLPCNIET